MALQPVSNRNTEPSQLTKTIVATPSAVHHHLTIKQENGKQQQQHQPQHDDGYRDQKIIMWATSSTNRQPHFCNSGEMAPEYSAQSPSMIVSLPQQHVNSHCSVTGPAYHLNKNRSLIPDPPSPPIHLHHPSWSTTFGANNNNPYATTWIGPTPPPLDAWKYSTLHQSASGSTLPMPYMDHLSSVHSIGVDGTNKRLQMDITEPLPHDVFSSRQGLATTYGSEGRHGDCISPTSPSPSTTLSFSPTSIQQPSSSKKQKQPQDHNGDAMTEEENKRQLYLVKNRQAASKCRQRKKEWIAHMQDTMASFTAENDVLHQQVMMLREEVLSLKTLLLMCKDCPQAQANGVYGLDSSMASSSSNWRCT